MVNMLSNLIKETGMNDKAIAMSCVDVMRVMLNELHFHISSLIRDNEVTNSKVTAYGLKHLECAFSIADMMNELGLLDNTNFVNYFDSLKCNDYERILELNTYITSLQNELIEL